MGRILKTTGQFLLLVVLIGQWFFLDRLRAENAVIENGTIEHSIARLAGAQYLSMYYKTKYVAMLRKSAREYANALSLMVSFSGCEDEEMQSGLLENIDRANSIKILGDYIALINSINEREQEIKSKIRDRAASTRHKKRIAWLVVLFASIFGLALIRRAEAMNH